MVRGTQRELEFPCPVCHVGQMCEHDIGYDECDSCDFWSIYDDGRDEYKEAEVRFAHEADARNYIERKANGS